MIPFFDFDFINIGYAYIALVLVLIYGLYKTSLSPLNTKNTKSNFSIIIPFRDEAENMNSLVTSINQLNYPKNQFEVIFINDNSHDNSVELIHKHILSEINYRVINNIPNTKSPKKDALSLAIKKSKYNWIVTTDADCIVPTNWLHFFDSEIEKGKLFICGAVNYLQTKSLLDKFQHTELISLIGATIGAFGIKKPIMCNAANMCFSKSAFQEVKGFSDKKNTVSGDDIFLLEKFNKYYPNQLSYIVHPEHTIITNTEKTIEAVINQRTRWASKATNYTNSFTIAVGVIVFLGNFLFTISLLNFIKLPSNLYFYTKILVDGWLIYKTCKFLNLKLHLIDYVWISLIYPIFTSFIALKSVFGNYNWKGRSFKR